MFKLRNDKVSLELDLEAQKAQEEIHKLTKEIENFRKQNTLNRKEISRLTAMEGDYSAEIERLNESIRNNSKEIDARKKSIEEERKKIEISRMSAADLGKEMKRLKKQLANTSRATNREAYKKLESEIRRVEKAYAQATKSTRGFFASLLSLDKIATSIKGFFMGLGMVITSYVVGAFKGLIDTIQDFERANSKLAAVLGTSIDGVSRLTKQAKFLGRTTTATASQVTGLQTELAKLGFSQDVIEKLTPATLKFAKAVDTDLSSAAAFAGAAMRMFNKDASEAEDVMATFAIATTKSALDFPKLQASLSTIGPVANAFGLSLEDTTALLGQLANAGFDASSAATATRNILLNLADANGDLAQALGGPVTSLDGMVKGMIKLNAEGVDLAKALELTDKRSVAAFSTFLNGADSMLALRDSITDCTGDFNKMAKTMADNAAGSWAGFQSAVEGLVLKFFDFREALKTVYEWATEFINWIGSIVDAVFPLGVVITAAAKKIGMLVAGIARLIKSTTDLFTQTKVGKGILNAVIFAFIAYKVAILATSKATKLFIKSLLTKASALAADAKALNFAAIKQIFLNSAMAANPLTFVITLISMATAAWMGYSMATDEAADSEEKLNEIQEIADKRREESNKSRDEINEKLALEKNRIDELIKIAGNEAESKERREKAIRRLNEICPEYNGYIDKETGALKGAKKALDEYLASMEKRMIFNYYKDNYEKYIRDIQAGKDKLQRMYDQNLKKAVRDRADLILKYSPELDLDEARQKAYNNLYNEYLQGDLNHELSQAFSEFNNADASLHELQADFCDLKSDMMKAGVDLADMLTEEVIPALDSTNSSAAKSVTRLKEINDELKRLRKIDPKSDEELDRINKRIEALRKEKKMLMGKSDKKRTPGTYGEDSLDEVTNPIDNAHQRRVLEINKKNLTMSEREIEKNRELIRYCSELSAALDILESKTDSTHAKTLDAIAKKKTEIAQQSAQAALNLDKATARQNEEYYQKHLEATKVFYAEKERIIKQKQADGLISEEAANVYLLNLQRQSNSDLLEETQRYFDELEDVNSMDVDTWVKTREGLAAKMNEFNNKILSDTGKLSETIRELSTDTTSAEGIANSFDRQRRAIEQTYEAAIQIVGKGTEQAVALEKEKQRRIAALSYQYLEQTWQLQELTGLSWGQEYDRELAQLENYHRQGLAKEKDYQRRKLELGVNNAKKYFDYYSQLSGSMFSALQEAEISQSEAKYDALIRQAANAGKDTAALEEEKENKKLEIQKKYADVDFAIKASEIIANTAVAIMTAYKQLGPVAGVVAAAMLTATGAAQLATAKAERDKVKNIQPGKSSASTTAGQPATAERVLSGYADGGYTGDGDRYEVAGVVHRGEYVVPKPIMNNPRVIDAVGLIESIRRNRVPSGPSWRPRSDGYADGGLVSAPITTESSELAKATRDLKEAARNIKAYVLFSDLEEKTEIMRRARDPFTRKN